MHMAPTAALPDMIEAPPRRRPTFQSWIRRAACARPRRVICLVAGIWLLNGFDLVLTVLAHQQGVLYEGNPIANYLLAFGVTALVLYKIGLVLIGSYPLLRYRTARVTELGTIVILVSYAFLAVHWSECYKLYTLSSNADVRVVEVVELIGLLN